MPPALLDALAWARPLQVPLIVLVALVGCCCCCCTLRLCRKCRRNPKKGGIAGMRRRDDSFTPDQFALHIKEDTPQAAENGIKHAVGSKPVDEQGNCRYEELAENNMSDNSSDFDIDSGLDASGSRRSVDSNKALRPRGASNPSVADRIEKRSLLTDMDVLVS